MAKLTASQRIEVLEAENASLRSRLAAVESVLPAPEKPILMKDLKVYGYQRPTLSIPEVNWMPSRDELKDLGRLVYAKYPYLIELTQEWLDQFRLCLLAVNHQGRTSKPRDNFGTLIGEWLTNHRYFGEIDRGPLMSAICASGDVIFSGYGERDMLAGTYPMSGIASRDCGTPPDRTAWKRVLAEKRLTGETAAAQVMDGKPDRWNNPRSTIQMLPHIDALKGSY